MCGVFGLTRDDVFEYPITEITDSIINRGRDGNGFWANNLGTVGLGHSRLSILELTPLGSQPMTSACERFVITFNGEIYNHLELRKVLERDYGKKVWRGNSDTETLVELISICGLSKSLNMIEGMFAFGIFDREYEILSIARDRVGEKPMFYQFENGNFTFSSSVRTFECLSQNGLKLNLAALSEYFKFGYIPTPLSIYHNVHKLPPGHFLTFDLRRSQLNRVECYWSLSSHYKDSRESKDTFTGRNTFEEVLSKTIEKQMIADVPLGIFLSGGLDSTAIAGIAQNIASDRLKSFTIGFGSSEYNEALSARAISEQIGTEHYEKYMTPSDVINAIEQVTSVFDEPFADSSQVPMLLLCQFAKEHVKVCLTGDGGDEIFGGYNRYLDGYLSWSLLKKVPLKIRKILKSIYQSYPNTSNRLISLFIGRSTKQLQNKIQKLIRALDAENISQYWYNVVGNDCIMKSLIKKDVSAKFHYELENLMQLEIDERQSLMLFDTYYYLPDDVLVKTDRTSMFVGIETRAPFLSHKVIEFASNLKFQEKIDGKIGKIPIREVISQKYGSKLFNKQKMGFTIPMADWLRADLKDWAKSLLLSEYENENSILDHDVLRDIWDKHQNNRYDYSQEIWTILQFLLWKKNKNYV